MLEVKNINYSYIKKEEVLHNINFTLNYGDFAYLVGVKTARGRQR